MKTNTNNNQTKTINTMKTNNKLKIKALYFLIEVVKCWQLLPLLVIMAIVIVFFGGLLMMGLSSTPWGRMVGMQLFASGIMGCLLLFPAMCCIIESNKIKSKIGDIVCYLYDKIDNLLGI